MSRHLYINKYQQYMKWPQWEPVLFPVANGLNKQYSLYAQCDMASRNSKPVCVQSNLSR